MADEQRLVDILPEREPKTDTPLLRPIEVDVGNLLDALERAKKEGDAVERGFDLMPHQDEISEFLKRSGFPGDPVRVFRIGHPLAVSNSPTDQSSGHAVSANDVVFLYEKDGQQQAVHLRTGIFKEKLREVLSRFGFSAVPMVGDDQEVAENTSQKATNNVVNFPNDGGAPFNENEKADDEDAAGQKQEQNAAETATAAESAQAQQAQQAQADQQAQAHQQAEADQAQQNQEAQDEKSLKKGNDRDKSEKEAEPRGKAVAQGGFGISIKSERVSQKQNAPAQPVQARQETQDESPIMSAADAFAAAAAVTSGPGARLHDQLRGWARRGEALSVHTARLEGLADNMVKAARHYQGVLQQHGWDPATGTLEQAQKLFEKPEVRNAASRLKRSITEFHKSALPGELGELVKAASTGRKQPKGAETFKLAGTHAQKASELFNSFNKQFGNLPLKDGKGDLRKLDEMTGPMRKRMEEAIQKLSEALSKVLGKLMGKRM